MRLPIPYLIAIGFFLSAALGTVPSSIAAEQTLTIEAPFARASIGQAKNGAAYLTIKNQGPTADRLIGVRADVSNRVELHTHDHKGGVVRMRAVEGINVPAGGQATLKPGGDHIMFMGLKAPLGKGTDVPITLVFEKAGTITVTIPVKGIAARSAGHSHHQHEGHDSGQHHNHGKKGEESGHGHSHRHGAPKTN